MAVDRERLAERLAAVERRLTDADPDEGGLADAAAVEGRLSELEGRADDLDERLGEVESGLQALRGYLGGIEAVDESVERRADAALAKAEELEEILVGDPDLRIERVPVDGNGGRDGSDGRDADGPDGPDAWEPGGVRSREDAGGDGSARTSPTDGCAPAHDTGGTGNRGEDGRSREERDGTADDRRLVDRLRDAL